jgi:uncharacterized delta-60 repeat protein
MSLGGGISLIVAGMLLGTEGARAAPSDLDTTFGLGGKVSTDFGGGDRVFALAIQPDGTLVAAGETGSIGPGASNLDFALARYRIDGTLDLSFGDGGKAVTSFGAHDQAYAVAVQGDGKIVSAGSTGNVFTLVSDFAVARYNVDGTLDATFGSGGLVRTDFFGGGDEAHALVLQPDGKVVAIGYATRSDGLPSFALVRYNPDGALDPTFGSGGKVTTEFAGPFLGPSARAFAATMQPDGRIIAAGFARPAFNTDFAAARYNTDGSLDMAFGTSGKTTTDIGEGDRALGVALQSDGKIVAAGTSGFFDYSFVRYNADGTLDTGFGSGGKVRALMPGNGEATAVAIQADGKIVAAGGAGFFGGFDYTILRLNSDGSRDGGFGVDGRVATDLGGHDVAQAMVLQTDGKIVVGGGAIGARGNDFTLLRYIGDPSDSTPPTVSCTPVPATIWPPNHKLATIEVTVVVQDDLSGPAGFTLTSVTSNEVDNGVDDGDTIDDIQGFTLGTPDTIGLLRAERSGSGTGRIYTLTYTGLDRAGNSTQATCSVMVRLN